MRRRRRKMLFSNHDNANENLQEDNRKRGPIQIDNPISVLPFNCLLTTLCSVQFHDSRHLPFFNFISPPPDPLSTDKTSSEINFYHFFFLFVSDKQIRSCWSCENRRNSRHLLFRSVRQIQCARYGITRSVTWRFVWFVWPTLCVENCYHDSNTISK